MAPAVAARPIDQVGERIDVDAVNAHAQVDITS
jgi:hypothetical protein